MKLKKEFQLAPMGEEYVLVPTGTAAEQFHGVVRLNQTAGFIVRCLERDTTSEAIVAALLDHYEVERATAEPNVAAILEKLREIDALC